MEGGWNLVTRKRRRTEKGALRSNIRADIASNVWYGRNDRDVTYFFSQFPDDHGAKEMLRIFTLYGKASEIKERQAWKTVWLRSVQRSERP